MATATESINWMLRVTEMADVQRDSYEALADNFAAFQRRGAGLAQDGLEFLKLQERNARAAQERWVNGVELIELQRRNARFAGDWLSGGVGLLRAQAEQNRRTVEVLVESARKQQEGLGRLAEEWVGAYQDFLGTYQEFFFSPFTYAQEGLRTVQRATQQGLQLIEEATEQTEQVIWQAERTIEDGDLQAAVLSALEADNYDALTVAEVSGKLDDLSVGDLKKIREYEKRNKNRETLVERIDRKIRATS